MPAVRALTHITKLDDASGQLLVRVSTVCGASRHIEPAFLASLVGPRATLKSLEQRLRCSLTLRKEGRRGGSDCEAEAAGRRALTETPPEGGEAHHHP